MSTLWTFGDSYTENFLKGIPKYIDWKGYVPKIYPEIIAEFLQLNLINLAKGGTNNYQIFQNICDNIENIKENDIIIISWTQIHRFRLVNENDEWEDFYNDKEHWQSKLKNMEYISKDTIRETIYNRLNKKYEEEIRSWEKILKLVLKNNKYIFWSPFAKEFRTKFNTIFEETNGKINDPHFSELGQLNLSKFLLTELGFNINKTII
jgi:hypothetical protein